jgi:hypothetical protein
LGTEFVARNIGGGIPPGTPDDAMGGGVFIKAICIIA